jgi:hypothetical protein
VVHHVPPTQWPKFLADTRRVTAPGGYVCIIEHNPFNPLTRLAISRYPFDDDAVLISARKHRALTKTCGFRDVGSRQFLLLPSASPVAGQIKTAPVSPALRAQYNGFRNGLNGTAPLLPRRPDGQATAIRGL